MGLEHAEGTQELGPVPCNTQRCGTLGGGREGTARELRPWKRRPTAERPQVRELRTGVRHLEVIGDLDMGHTIECLEWIPEVTWRQHPGSIHPSS